MPRLTISEPNKAPQPYRFPVDCKLISVGKSSANDIVIDCGSVSGEHCMIERIKGGYIIRDNGSTNGVEQNGELVVIGDLSNDAEVLIGEVPLRFQLSEEELDAINKEDFTPSRNVNELGITALPEAEEARPSPKKKLPPTTPSANARPSLSSPPLMAEPSSMGFGTVIMLGAFAIAVGMCIRHQMDTGSFLLTELLVKYTS